VGEGVVGTKTDAEVSDPHPVSSAPSTKTSPSAPPTRCLLIMENPAKSTASSETDGTDRGARLSAARCKSQKQRAWQR